MSITASTFSAIQKAGEQLRTARLAMAQDLQKNAQWMVDAVASQPFGAQADRLYAQLRTVSRLAHDLQAAEDQLGEIYRAAADLMAQSQQAVVEALPGTRKNSVQITQLAHQRSDAQDVDFTHGKAGKNSKATKGSKVTKAPKTGKPGKGKKAVAPATKAAEAAIPVAAKSTKAVKRAAKAVVRQADRAVKQLSGNDLKVQAFLRKSLNTQDWTPLTKVAIAQGSGLPQGSIGIAMRRVLAIGGVQEGREKGTYKLRA